MAQGKTEICNLAVGWLGGQHITSIDNDKSLAARLCKANYHMSRKAVLEEREWTFAVRRGRLSPLSSPPPFGYNYQFLLPPDLLTVTNLYDPKQDKYRAVSKGIPYVREGNVVMADLPEVDIKYKVDLKDTRKFSGLFDQALAAHIASNIAIGLTGNDTQQERMYSIYDDKLNRAITSDSLQGSIEYIETSTLEESRRMFVNPR